MTLARTFIFHEQQHVDSCVAFIKANWQAMSRRDKPMAVRAYEYQSKRKLEQNNLMWAWLGELAGQAWANGRQFSDDVWHEHVKREFLPDETAAGVKKWDYLPSGERVLVMSTTDLNVSEFALYLTAIEAWAAQELGITFNAPEPQPA
jgi:hypothetical protein